MDRHIRDVVLKEYLVHRNYHAYQSGKSTETALHHESQRIGNTSECKEIALEELLDTSIVGALGRNNF
jgi:hypothetical protein